VTHRTVYVGSDHAGFLFKNQLIKKLKTEFPDLDFKDMGCDSEASVDYPVVAEKVARMVVKETEGRGILICGSGLGMCVAANKIRGIRATSSWNLESARLSREHNNSNIICLGARLLPEPLAFDAVKVWLTTAFLGDRHLRRVQLIEKLEEKP